MIKFVRIIMKELARDYNPYMFTELYFDNLIEWEKDQIKHKFENIQSRHVSSSQSDLVERKLTEALRVLQEKETPKQIDWVEKTPAISIETETGKRTRYPDVYIKLTRQTISDRKKAFEIQVKMYEKNKFVKLKHIDSSLELLERAYTDALLFAMTGAGLEEKAIEEINKLNLSDRVLYYKSFEDEQFQALSFLAYYEDITGRKLTVNVIIEILEILFEESWDNIIKQIRNIGSFRAKRISGKIKEKEKSTLTGFLEKKPQTEIILESQTETKVEKEIESSSGNTILGDSAEPTKVEPPKTEGEIREELKLGNVIKELKLEGSLKILEIIYNRYLDNFNELEFIFKCVSKRIDRYKGRATKDYLKKRVPAHLSDEIINELFLRLKNEDSKNQIKTEERIFTYKGTSISITNIGKKFYEILKKLKEKE